MPAGTVPLATGWQETPDAPEKSTCLVIPFLQNKEALSDLPANDKIDIKQFIEIVFRDNKDSPTWRDNDATISAWIAEALSSP